MRQLKKSRSIAAPALEAPPQSQFPDNLWFDIPLPDRGLLLNFLITIVLPSMVMPSCLLGKVAKTPAFESVVPAIIFRLNGNFNSLRRDAAIRYQKVLLNETLFCSPNRL